MLTFYENLHFNIIGLLPIKWINKTELSTAVADANYANFFTAEETSVEVVFSCIYTDSLMKHECIYTAKLLYNI